MGFYILVQGSLLCCVSGLLLDISAVVLAQAVLFAVVVAELAKLLTQIIHYRVGS